MGETGNSPILNIGLQAIIIIPHMIERETVICAVFIALVLYFLSLHD